MADRPYRPHATGQCEFPGCSSPSGHYTDLDDEAFIRFRARHCDAHWRELWQTLLAFGFESDSRGLPQDYLGARVVKR